MVNNTGIPEIVLYNRIIYMTGQGLQKHKEICISSIHRRSTHYHLIFVFMFADNSTPSTYTNSTRTNTVAPGTASLVYI